MTTVSFEIDQDQFSDPDGLESRATNAPEPDQDVLRHVLHYLYLADGPTSVTREQRIQAEPALSPVERYVLQWMFKRTDGKLKRFYGELALRAVKAAGYRCEQCGFRDVRALNLERQEPAEKEGQPTFVCLCANCNTVAARAKEMANLQAQQLAQQAAKEAAQKVAKASETDANTESTQGVAEGSNTDEKNTDENNREQATEVAKEDNLGA